MKNAFSVYGSICDIWYTKYVIIHVNLYHTHTHNLQCRRPGFEPWAGKIPWRRERLPTPVFWPGKFHGLYSPWGHKKLCPTEWFSLHFTHNLCALKNHFSHNEQAYLINSTYGNLTCSVQFSRSVMLDSLWPYELQHASPPCPSSTPGVYSNSCPLSQWCHRTISSSVAPFSSCPQSLPASGSSPMSQLFAWGCQSIRVSASASVLPMNTQDWSPLGDWISLQSKGLSRVFSNTTVQKHQFFGTQLSLQFSSHIHTWLLEKPQLWLDGPWLTK